MDNETTKNYTTKDQANQVHALVRFFGSEVSLQIDGNKTCLICLKGIYSLYGLAMRPRQINETHIR